MRNTSTGQERGRESSQRVSRCNVMTFQPGRVIGLRERGVRPMGSAGELGLNERVSGCPEILRDTQGLSAIRGQIEEGKRVYARVRARLRKRLTHRSASKAARFKDAHSSRMNSPHFPGCDCGGDGCWMVQTLHTPVRQPVKLVPLSDGKKPTAQKTPTRPLPMPKPIPAGLA